MRATGWYILALISAFVAGAVMAGVYGAHQIAATKAYTDSVQTAGHVRDSLATRWADSVRAVVAADTAKTKVRIRFVEVKSATADSLRTELGHAKTAADSLPIRTAQVAVLQSEVDTLKAQVRQDTLDLWRAMARGDSLQRVVWSDDAAMLAMRNKIDALNAPKLPKLLSISLEVAKDAGLVYGGIQIGKAIAKR